MKRLGLSCNLLLATLFLALASAASGVRAQDLLSALPPKPKEPPPPPPLSTFALTLPKPSETLPKESTAAKKPAPEKTETARARLLERFDRNKDGRLDADERAEAQKFAKERAGATTRAARERMAKATAAADTLRTEMRRRFDRNANGTIDDDEMPALEKTVRNRPSTALLRQRFDRNHDGKIDDGELKKARPQLQHWLNESPAKAAKNKE